MKIWIKKWIYFLIKFGKELGNDQPIPPVIKKLKNIAKIFKTKLIQIKYSTQNIVISNNTKVKIGLKTRRKNGRTLHIVTRQVTQHNEIVRSVVTGTVSPTKFERIAVKARMSVKKSS